MFLDNDLINHLKIHLPNLEVDYLSEKIYDTKINKYITHKGYEIDEFNGVVVHFAGGPGNYQIKHEKMDLFFKKINLL